MSESEQFEDQGWPESSFESLPVEVLVKILCLANLETKKIERLVCKRWLCIIDERLCFVVKSIPNQDCLDGIFTTTKELQLVQASLLDYNYKLPSATTSRNPAPRIRKLIIGDGNSEKAVMYFLKHFSSNVYYTKIQREGIAGSDMIRGFQSVIPKIDWGTMRKLSLDVQKCDCSHAKFAFRNTKSLLKLATIPNLVHFKFGVIHHFPNHSSELTDLCVELCNFFARHKTALKKTKVSFNTTYTPPDISKQISFLRQQLKLEEFNFIVVNRGLKQTKGSELGVIGMAMMAGARKLKTFSYVEIKEKSSSSSQIPTLASELGKVLELNGPTLTFLELGLATIKSNWLTTCTQLKILNFEGVKFFQPYLNSTQTLNLKSVTEFQFGYGTLTTPIVTWITENLSNLTLLTLVRSNMDTDMLRSLLNLQFLRKIVLSKFIYDSAINLVKDHCDKTDGLEIQMPVNHCPCHRKTVITIQEN